MSSDAPSCHSCRAEAELARTALPATLDGSSPPMPRSHQTPARVGRFEISGLLGSGAMGVVYRAMDPDLRREVAIKVVKHSNQMGARERMLREAQAMAQLDHPNAVRVYEVGTTDEDTIFIAMEFVAGTTLTGWLQTGPSAAQIVDAFIQAAAGLSAAHELGIVHRDFKPDNVLVDEAGRVKVSDFGLARAATLVDPEGAEPQSPLQLSMTQTGSLVGTPRYMAPEQLRGEVAELRSDQFGFCVALYESVFGARPFDGESLIGLYQAIERGARVPSGPRHVMWLWPVLRRGLEYDAAQRYGSLRALQEALSSAQNRHRRRPWLVAAGVSVVFGAAITAGIMLQPEPEPDPVEAVWNPQRAAQLLTQMQRSSPRPANFVTAEHQRVRTAIDTRMTEWRTATALVAGDASASTDIRRFRSQCLDERLVDIGMLLAAAATARVDIVENLGEVVSSLHRPMTCTTAATTRARDGVMRRSSNQRLSMSVHRMHSLSELGDHAAALEEATRLEPTVRHDGSPRLVGNFLKAKARALQAVARFDEARTALQQGLQLTDSIGDDEFELSILCALIDDAVSRRNDTTVAESLAVRAQTVVQRLATSATALVLAENEASYAQAMLQIAKLRGDAQALEKFARMRIDRVKIAYGERSRQHARAMLTEARVRTVSTNVAWDEVYAAGDRALAILRDIVGVGHPALAAALQEVGTLHITGGDFEGARPPLREADEIYVRTYGPRHQKRVDVVTSLANVEVSTSHYKEGLELATQAATLATETFGPEAREVSLPLQFLASAQVQLGRAAEAKRSLARANQIEEHVNPGAPRSLTLLLVEVQIETALGNFSMARTLLASAIKTYGAEIELTILIAQLHASEANYADSLTVIRDLLAQSSSGAKGPSLLRAFMLEVEAVALVGLGRMREGLAAVEQAGTLRDQLGAPLDNARVLLAKSKALSVVRRDQRAARALAIEARERAIAAPDNADDRRTAAEATDWLAQLER